jgi:phage replication-related protein YjqB (UPF0714/DUF867 family)
MSHCKQSYKGSYVEGGTTRALDQSGYRTALMVTLTGKIEKSSNRGRLNMSIDRQWSTSTRRNLIIGFGISTVTDTFDEETAGG